MFVSIIAFWLKIKTGTTYLPFVKVFEAQGSGGRFRSVPGPGWKWIRVPSPARSAHLRFPKCQQVSASSLSHCRQTSGSLSATNQTNQCHPHIYAPNVRFLGPKFYIRCTRSPLPFKITKTWKTWQVFGKWIKEKYHLIFQYPCDRFICYNEHPSMAFFRVFFADSGKFLSKIMSWIKIFAELERKFSEF